jgi:hypothetical protein
MLIAVVLSSLLIASVNAEATVLTPDNFNEFVGGDKVRIHCRKAGSLSTSRLVSDHFPAL